MSSQNHQLTVTCGVVRIEGNACQRAQRLSVGMEDVSKPLRGPHSVLSKEKGRSVKSRPVTTSLLY